MMDYSSTAEIPWYSYAGDIVVVELSDGITYLGQGNLFMIGYEQITIPESVVGIASHNGQGIWELKVNYEGSNSSWNSIAICEGDKLSNMLILSATVDAEKQNADVCQSGIIDSTDHSWILYNDGTLIIDGTGNMPEWSETNLPPWNIYRDEIVKLVISGNIENVGSYAFYNMDTLQSARIGSLVKTIDEYAFYECDNLLAVAMGKDSILQEIDEQAFYYCINLRCVNLLDSVETIGREAFEYCTSLRYILQFNCVKNLENYAFFGCEKLKQITLPEGLRVVPYAAFGRCFELCYVNIPSTIIKIEESAFFVGDGTNLVVDYAGSKEHWNTKVIDYGNISIDNAIINFGREISALGNVNEDIKWTLEDSGVLVIDGTGDMPNYADGIGVNDQDIAEWVREDYHTVIISDGITSIGDYAFLWAENLTTVVMTNGVYNISWNAFDGCYSPITIYVIGYEDEFEPIVNGASYPNNVTFSFY